MTHKQVVSYIFECHESYVNDTKIYTITQQLFITVKDYFKYGNYATVLNLYDGVVSATTPGLEGLQSFFKIPQDQNCYLILRT